MEKKGKNQNELGDERVKEPAAWTALEGDRKAVEIWH